MLKDRDIRQVLLNEIVRQNFSHDYRIIEELSVCDGDARVDIAVANGKLYGYEIKSDADTLERLSSQRQYYDQTFDRIVIAVGAKYKDTIKEHIPDYWGIYVIHPNKSSKLSISLQRKPKANPNIDITSLLSLLVKDELYTLLKSRNINGISGKNIRILRSIAIHSFTKTELRNYTREILKHRIYKGEDNN